MGNYRQIYTVPFDGALPAQQDNGLSDSFSTGSVQLVNNIGQPVPGFTIIDPKWSRWDPGNLITFAGVDATIQMAVLRATGAKPWCGYLQSLPLPEVGTTSEQVFSMRALLGPVSGLATIGGGYGPVSAGLVLGRDLVANPATDSFRVLGPQLALSGTSPQGVNQVVVLQDVAAFDSPSTPLSEALTGWQFVRVRVSQQRVDANTINVRESWEISMSGCDWTVLYAATNNGADISVAYRTVGFALSIGTSFTPSPDPYSGQVLVDFFTTQTQAYSAGGGLVGGTQTLGAV